MNLTELTEQIEQWAKERNLDTADPNKQMLKLGEEFGELCQGMAKDNMDQVIDSIGDMFVVMTILSRQLGINIECCVLDAYNEIKDRKGKMVNGVFVKESDLA
ncbi:Phosphoribosyl-ATP pyrophosphohydrolase [Oceanobacillus limi]|uniref:Phosphoribosyl-ATP pyrophosphohydrolase n=1 Tax=Oceanobacillus limi TaxID=930131 RepID=A0A1I0GZ07_9BACI|nr:MazG-like family protein [Oceanobacillus limi]SET76481.1 Phosphoribosyl-ATP pyrophosphohydrolase [Oceanobacillus limi]